MGAHRGRVREVTPELGIAHHRGAVAGGRGDLLERLPRLGHERRPQQQVFGRVPGDRQLRERHEVAAEVFGLLVGGEDALRVALEVADDEVELGGSHTEAGHGLRIRDTSGMVAGVSP